MSLVGRWKTMPGTVMKIEGPTQAQDERGPDQESWEQGPDWPYT